MTLRTLVASALVLLLGTTAAVAQQQTGEIFGKAADTSGAVLPGATVTVAGPALIQPRVAVTSETGTYRVPELPIGTYSVTFELAGFRTWRCRTSASPSASARRSTARWSSRPCRRP